MASKWSSTQWRSMRANIKIVEDLAISQEDKQREQFTMENCVKISIFLGSVNTMIHQCVIIYHQTFVFKGKTHNLQTQKYEITGKKKYLTFPPMEYLFSPKHYITRKRSLECMSLSLPIRVHRQTDRHIQRQTEWPITQSPPIHFIPLGEIKIWWKPKQRYKTKHEWVFLFLNTA